MAVATNEPVPRKSSIPLSLRSSADRQLVLRTHRRHFRRPAAQRPLPVCTSNSADLAGARDSGMTKASVTTSGVPTSVECGGADTPLVSLPTLSRRGPTTGAKAVDYFDAIHGSGGGPSRLGRRLKQEGGIAVCPRKWEG